MGYTTRFSGKFDIDAELTLGQFNHLRTMNDACDGLSEGPGGYCQWRPTDDGLHIEWDGGEKFYNYEEWLRHICRTYLAQWGRKLNGEVRWSGEDTEDVGVLRVVDNVVTAEKLVPAGTKVKCPECRHEFRVETK